MDSVADQVFIDAIYSYSTRKSADAYLANLHATLRNGLQERSR